jgi:cytosine/uracil/thiamine/allantoin permease
MKMTIKVIVFASVMVPAFGILFATMPIVVGVLFIGFMYYSVRD